MRWLQPCCRPAAAAGSPAAESGIEENLPVRRTVERPHRRLRHATAAAIRGVAKQHDARTRIGLSAGLEDFAPAIVDLAEDARDHAADLVGRRAAFCGSGSAIGLIARRMVAAGENFRATDQDAWIDPERVADKPQHDDGADAKSAASHRKTKATTAAKSTAIIA